MSVIVNKKNIENHCTLQAAPEIRAISRDFLEKYHLNHYNYIRIYPDNSEFSLSTHAEMSVDFYKHAFYNLCDFEKDYSTHENAIMLYLGGNEKELQLFNHSKEYYDCTHGIILLRNQDKYQELIHFAAPAVNQSANNFYINNIDLLDNFTVMFKEKMADLILQSSKDRIYLPQKQLTGSNDPLRQRISVNDIDGLKSPIQHLTLDLMVNLSEAQLQKLLRKRSWKIKLGNLSIPISRREVQCLAGLIKGKHAGEISKSLNLQQNTIEFYIANLKNKLGVTTRSDLLDAVFRYKIIQQFTL